MSNEKPRMMQLTLPGMDKPTVPLNRVVMIHERVSSVFSNHPIGEAEVFPRVDKECVEPRPEVMAFAVAMEKKLRENDHKGGWQNLGSMDLSLLLVQEVVELLTACGASKQLISSITKAKISGLDAHDFESDPKLEAVDTANFAMMFYDNLVNGRIQCRQPKS